MQIPWCTHLPQTVFFFFLQFDAVSQDFKITVIVVESYKYLQLLCFSHTKCSWTKHFWNSWMLWALKSFLYELLCEPTWFNKNFCFKNSLWFIAKLRGRYRDFQYTTSCTHVDSHVIKIHHEWYICYNWWTYMTYHY